MLKIMKQSGPFQLAIDTVVDIQIDFADENNIILQWNEKNDISQFCSCYHSTSSAVHSKGLQRDIATSDRQTDRQTKFWYFLTKLKVSRPFQPVSDTVFDAESEFTNEKPPNRQENENFKPKNSEKNRKNQKKY